MFWLIYLVAEQPPNKIQTTLHYSETPAITAQALQMHLHRCTAAITKAKQKQTITDD